MQSEDLSIKFTEEQSALRSRLSSLSWFARLDEYQQLFVVQLWQKADASGVLTKDAFPIADIHDRYGDRAYGAMLHRVGVIRKYLGHTFPSVLTEFGDKFFFNDYIVVTYGTLTLSDPKHYEVYCQLMEHDLDVGTMLRYVPMQR